MRKAKSNHIVPKRILFTEEQVNYLTENMKQFIPLKNSINNMFSNKYKLFETVENTILLEGLLSTYPIDTIIKHLEKYLNFTTDYSKFVLNKDKYSGFVEKVQCDNGEETLQLIFFDNEFNRDRVEKCMTLCGFFYSTEIKYRNNYVHVIYEKSHENKINTIVHNKEYIYHITINDKIEKIKRQGLLPKANNKLSKHPERVYFFIEKPSEEICNIMIQQMYGYSDKVKCCLLTIKTEGLSNDFYFDPNCMHAVYTDEYVPKENIVNIQNINK